VRRDRGSVTGLIVLTALFGACGNEGLARNDGGGNETGCPEVSIDGAQSLFQQSCGGTATATGTSPVGAFSAGLVGVSYHCGNVVVEVTDASGFARLALVFPFSAGAIGERNAAVTFNGPPRGDVLVQATGQVTIAAISDPSPTSDAGSSAWGMVEGTFSITSDCLSITGSFASPYCAYDSLCG